MEIELEAAGVQLSCGSRVSFFGSEEKGFRLADWARVQAVGELRERLSCSTVGMGPTMLAGLGSFGRNFTAVVWRSQPQGFVELS